MYQDDFTAVVIDQTFQLPQPIDTLVSVNVEPSQLIETKEGLRGTLDLMIYYEPCAERDYETDITQEALLITDIRESETNEVCAYFSFPIELYSVSEKTHLVISELDYVLPTRSTFTLKANVQVFQPNKRKDEPIELIEEKDEVINHHQINERVMDEDVLVYTPKKQLDMPSPGEPEQLQHQDKAIGQRNQTEETTNKMDKVEETTRQADGINSQKADQLTNQDDTSSTKIETETRMEVTEVEAIEEEEVMTKEVNDKAIRVIYQHYGLKRLDNPHVKLPCVIVKEDVSLSEWCHEHGFEVTKLKRVNPHVDETIQAGQVLIIPDGVSYT
ncbi:MAG: hypothetical protein ACQER2_07615 [Bacillota bacterium]